MKPDWSGGFVPPRPLNPEEMNTITKALEARRGAQFHEKGARAGFLSGVEAALARLELRRTWPQDIVGMSRHQLARLIDTAAVFGDALGKLDMVEENLSFLSTSGVDLDRLRSDVETARAAASKDIDALKPKRPGPQTQGPDAQFALEIAHTWQAVFGSRPSPAKEGAFMNVANVIMDIAGSPSFGEKAMNSILRHLP